MSETGIFIFFFLFRILQAVCYFLLPIVFLITSMAPFLEASSSYLHSLIIQSHIPVNRWQHIIFHILTPRIRDSCSSSPLRGSQGLSARREQRTKSSRSEGPKAGPKVRQLEVGARLYKYKWYACGVMIRYDQACNLCNLIQESEWWWRQCCIPFSAQGYTASYEKIKIMTIAMMRTRKNMMVLCKDFFSSSAQKNVADNDVSLKILNIRNKEET